MNPRIRYCVELEKVRHLPNYQRLRAEKRFLLLKEYENVFLKREIKELGSAFRKYNATKKFCQIKEVPETTFFRWYRAYKNMGIEGLIPLYGSRSWENSSMAFFDQEKSKREKKHPKHIITIRLDIRADKPLLCLEKIEKAIAASTLIAPETKASCTHAIKHICGLLHRRTPMRLRSPLTEEEKQCLEHYRAGLHKNHSIKATAILMMNAGRTMFDIGMETNASESTIYKWLHGFNEKRLDFIEVKLHSPARLEAQELRKTRVIDIIHKMPSLYDINRTTWTFGTIAEAFQKEYGESLTPNTLQRIIKTTGYSWRRARNVLTSPDPDYKAKVEKLLDTLQGLKEGERFFFIDEAGPYRVKKYGGRVLVPKDQIPTVPEFQRSRGRIQFVAALEAVTNQLLWLFTPDKCAASMISLLEMITRDYADCPAIFFTWDAITVHSAKAVVAWISSHNKAARGPHIEIVPLPSKAQFLNVIESVFCGMKKAVICNSDYATPHDMQEAIARHFEERNAYYQENPKRAGNKIWDKQKFDFNRLAGGLFKKM